MKHLPNRFCGRDRRQSSFSAENLIMHIHLIINNEEKTVTCTPDDTLLRVLRREGYFSVRFGSDTGETGAAAIRLDGELVTADIMLAAQADGHTIETIEGMSTASICILFSVPSSKQARFNPAITRRRWCWPQSAARSAPTHWG